MKILLLEKRLSVVGSFFIAFCVKFNYNYRIEAYRNSKS